MEDRIRDFVVIFTSILYEAMPFIVLGAVIAGLLEELVPQRIVARVIPKSRILAIAIGGILGLVFPMCECGIIPVMRRLLRKGVPLSACVCYLLAGPIINVVVMLSTYVAFDGMQNLRVGGEQVHRHLGGGEMVIARVGLGYLVAFCTSLIVEWQYRKYGNALLAPLAVPPPIPEAAAPEAGSEENGREPFLHRLGRVTETALHDFIDITVFLILGALLSAFVRQLLTHQDVEDLSNTYPIAAVGSMMILALLLCLCSEADAFVAASFTALKPAAKLAFLVLGPMMDLKLFLMYTRIFRPRLIATIITSVIVQVFVYCLILYYVYEGYGPSWSDGQTGGPAAAAASQSRP